MIHRHLQLATTSSQPLTSKSKRKKDTERVMMAPAAAVLGPILEAPVEESRGAKRVKRQKLLTQIGGDDNGRTVLEKASVTDACRKRYENIWSELAPLVTTTFGCLLSVSQIDNVLCQQLEEQFLDGLNVASGQYLVAAFLYFNPSLKSPSMQWLPRVKQALAGWKRLAPPQARMPIPYEVVVLMACRPFLKGLKEVGLFLLLAFALYLRPSEGLRIRSKDVVAPVQRRGTSSRWQFVLNLMEGQVPSKTKEFDETLALDLDYHAHLGQAIHRCLHLSRMNLEQFIFSITAKELNDFLASAQQELELRPLGPLHLYRLRHGGASHDFNSKFRDLTAIQQRGRWKSFNSVRRYQKGGRVAQLFGSLAPAVRNRCLRAAASLPATLRSLR